MTKNKENKIVVAIVVAVLLYVLFAYSVSIAKGALIFTANDISKLATSTSDVVIKK